MYYKGEKMKYNYHTHTVRCHHAEGADEEFVLAAIEAGFDEIGFADHSPWPFEKDFVSHIRMTEDELGGYCDSVKALREKYKDKINIKLGLECEYFPKYLPWLKEKIREHKIDYLICGHHFCTDEPGNIYNGSITDSKGLEDYKNDILEALDSGIFSYIAHPDIFMRGYPVFDEKCEEVTRAIIEKAKETNTPLEYNLLGLKHGINDGKPGYPHPSFWKIAGEYKPPVVIGVDAHVPEAYGESDIYRTAVELLSSYGLEITDKIKFFEHK